MRLRISGTPGIVLVALSLASCKAATPARDGDSSAPPVASAPAPAVTAAPDSLRLRLVAPTEVRAGRPVSIALRLENVGSRPLDLYLRGRTIAFDVAVTRAAGDTVWNRLHDEVIPAIVQLRVLAPGEVLELRHDWDQRDNRGRRVVPGAYVVRASILTDAPAAIESEAAPLRITPGA